MSARTDGELSLRQSVIKQQCLLLRLPTLASQCGSLAEQAERERQPYLGYLEALLAAELEERERRAIDRRIKDAHLPRVKTLDEFDFRQAPMVSPTRISAHYGEFVQWERWKANGQFGAKRTVVSVMPNEVVQRSCVEAMALSMMKWVG